MTDGDDAQYSNKYIHDFTIIMPLCDSITVQPQRQYDTSSSDG